MKNQFLPILALTLLSALMLGDLNTASADSVVFVNFTNASDTPATAANPFNALNSAGGPLALNDDTGAATGFSVGITSSNNGGNSTGAPSVGGNAAAAGITAVEGGTYHFVNDSTTGTYQFSGLDPTQLYTFTVFGSRNAGDFRETRYTLSDGVTSSFADLTTAGPVNTSNVSLFSNLTAPTGTLNLSFAHQSSNSQAFGYINAVRIDAIDAVPEPSSLALGLVGLVAMVTRRRRS